MRNQDAVISAVRLSLELKRLKVSLELYKSPN